MEGKPFVLIGVNSDDSPKTALAAVKKNELNWRSFQNERKGTTSISTDWNVSAWPTIVVIDGKGNIVYRGHDGEEATKIAAKIVAKIVAKTKQSEEEALLRDRNGKH